MSKNINIILTLLIFSNCLQKPPVIVEDPIQIDEVKLESKDKIKRGIIMLLKLMENLLKIVEVDYLVLIQLIILIG